MLSSQDPVELEEEEEDEEENDESKEDDKTKALSYIDRVRSLNVLLLFK